MSKTFFSAEKRHLCIHCAPCMDHVHVQCVHSKPWFLHSSCLAIPSPAPSVQSMASDGSASLGAKGKSKHVNGDPSTGNTALYSSESFKGKVVSEKGTGKLSYKGKFEKGYGKPGSEVVPSKGKKGHSKDGLPMSSGDKGMEKGSMEKGMEKGKYKSTCTDTEPPNAEPNKGVGKKGFWKGTEKGKYKSKSMDTNSSPDMTEPPGACRDESSKGSGKNEERKGFFKGMEKGKYESKGSNDVVPMDVDPVPSDVTPNKGFGKNKGKYKSKTTEVETRDDTDPPPNKFEVKGKGKDSETSTEGYKGDPLTLKGKSPAKGKVGKDFGKGKIHKGYPAGKSAAAETKGNTIAPTHPGKGKSDIAPSNETKDNSDSKGMGKSDCTAAAAPKDMRGETIFVLCLTFVSIGYGYVDLSLDCKVSFDMLLRCACMFVHMLFI